MFNFIILTSQNLAPFTNLTNKKNLIKNEIFIMF